MSRAKGCDNTSISQIFHYTAEKCYDIMHFGFLYI